MESFHQNQELGSSLNSRLWYESLFSKLRLPFWLGTAIFSVVPFVVLLLLGYYLAGVWADLYTSGLIFFAPIVAIVSAYMFYGARYIKRKMEGLAKYCDTLREDGSKTTLAGLYSFRAVLVTFLVLASIIQPIYIYSVALPHSYSILQGIEVTLPFTYWAIMIATMTWTFGYSMFAIFRMGRAPLKLKSFTEDRELGLRPFGVTSLRLTGTFFLLLALIFGPQTAFGFLTPGVQAAVFGLVVLGTALFFLPLLRYRRTLVHAKQQRMKWVASQYTDLVKRIEQGGIKGTDASLANELIVIEKLQGDIRQIHDWPFDVGVIARLAAIVLSILTVLLSSFIQNALHL